MKITIKLNGWMHAWYMYSVCVCVVGCFFSSDLSSYFIICVGTSELRKQVQYTIDSENFSWNDGTLTLSLYLTLAVPIVCSWSGDRWRQSGGMRWIVEGRGALKICWKWRFSSKMLQLGSFSLLLLLFSFFFVVSFFFSSFIYFCFCSSFSCLIH